jgi:hypothetical protein
MESQDSYNNPARFFAFYYLFAITGYKDYREDFLFWLSYHKESMASRSLIPFIIGGLELIYAILYLMYANSFPPLLALTAPIAICDGTVFIMGGIFVIHISKKNGKDKSIISLPPKGNGLHFAYFLIMVSISISLIAVIFFNSEDIKSIVTPLFYGSLICLGWYLLWIVNFENSTPTPPMLGS